MKDQNDNFGDQPETADQPQSAGRRSLLKGTATALPAILTLQSGAALARSSNLISTTQYKSPDRLGRTLCLDLDSVGEVPGSTTTFDMGSNPTAQIYAINKREYHIEPNRGSAETDGQAICEGGGPAFYKETGWVELKTQHRAPGGMISISAYVSIAGSGVDVTEL